MDKKEVSTKLSRKLYRDLSELGRIYGPYVEAGFEFKPVTYDSMTVRFDTSNRTVGVYKGDSIVNSENSSNETLFRAIMAVKVAWKTWRDKKTKIDNVLSSID